MIADIGRGAQPPLRNRPVKAQSIRNQPIG
jgi:hypothetical protein